MKKRLLLLFTAIIAALGLCGLVVGCNNDGEKVEYSVTVVSPEEAPLSGITVSWITGSKAAGSATTGDDGKATAMLVAGTYKIALDGYADGLSYPDISVSSSMRNITLPLSVAQVKYTATVLDKTGAPAAGVTVTWTDGENIYSAVTGDDGKAECEIPYGEYSVTLSNLPAGNVFDGELTATGKAPTVQAELIDGVSTQYRVTVRSAGGLLFKKQPVSAFSGSRLVASGLTDDNGVYTFSAQGGSYTVRALSIPNGYTAATAYLSATVTEGAVVLTSAVIKTAPATSTRYVIGDIIHDYSFTTPYSINGSPKTYKISDILQTKDAIIINNWGTKCTWCVQEMPAMNEAYLKYKDSIELIAVSNYQGGDSDSTIADYYNRYQYTFPMMRDLNGLATKFELTNFPSTVVIDRYGAIARIEAGAILDADVWGRMIEKYIGDEYVQTFTPGAHESESITTEIAKPDVTVPDDHYETVAEVLNNTDEFPEGASVVWRGETEYEYAWPFVLDTDPDVSPNDRVLYSSNTKKANSMSVIYADVTVDAGKVLTFDYYSDTQAGRDVLSVVWDGKIIKEISGNSDGWQTCHLYTDLVSGKHTLAMAYIKDSSGNTGKDNVYFRNVRFTEVADITDSTDMLRAAAYGVPAAGADKFPYYATVELSETDGYYHVKLSELESASFAGNDQSPMLFVNLMNVTNWMNDASIADIVFDADPVSGEYTLDCRFNINGVQKDYRDDIVAYLQTASASDIYGFVPVDKNLHDLLVALMARVSGSKSHADEWLEACYFYSHYGTGETIGNPIIGLTDKTAIPVTVGTNTADLTRNMRPYPSTIYKFEPETSGVYNFHSLIPSKDAAQYQAQIWLYGENGTSGKELIYSGGDRLFRDGVDEQNFNIYRYMQAGETYYIVLAFLMNESGTYDFVITNVGESYTVLEPASANVFGFATDANGNYTNQIILLGAVDYELVSEGNTAYYHVKNGDTVGDYIYLDVKYATALTNYSITQLVEQKQHDPMDGSDLDYNVFDFRYMIAYFEETTEEGVLTTYDPKVDITSFGAKYKDYTQIMRDYIATAPTTGPDAGLVKVDAQLVEILTLLIETRVNMMMNGRGEAAFSNEWLRFCWYYRTYDSAHV